MIGPDGQAIQAQAARPIDGAPARARARCRTQDRPIGALNQRLRTAPSARSDSAGPGRRAQAGPGVKLGRARLQIAEGRCGMERERFVIVRLHPALNGDCEGEHPHFRPQPGGSRLLECVFHRVFAPGGPAPRLGLLECRVAHA